MKFEEKVNEFLRKNDGCLFEELVKALNTCLYSDKQVRNSLKIMREKRKIHTIVRYEGGLGLVARAYYA